MFGNIQYGELIYLMTQFNILIFKHGFFFVVTLKAFLKRAY